MNTQDDKFTIYADQRRLDLYVRTLCPATDHNVYSYGEIQISLLVYGAEGQ